MNNGEDINPSPILFVIQRVTIDTMLNSNGQKIGDGLNFVTCLLAIILIFCKALESI